MRIEEIDVGSISGLSNRELYDMRLRFIQIYTKNLSGGGGWGLMSEDRFYTKYRILLEEMEKRGMVYSRHEIDEISKSSYPSAVVVTGYVSIVGSYVHTPEEASDLDILIRASERDESLEVKLRKVFGGVDKQLHFIYNEAGAHSDYIPIYDLVLVDSGEHSVVVVEEGIKRYREYYNRMACDSRLDRDREIVSRYIVGCSVLDVGGGSGELSRFYDGDRYTCLDCNAVAISMCVESGIDCKLGDAIRLPYDDSSYDTVVFCHSLEHVKDIETAIREAERVASRRVVIVIPLGSSADETHEHIFELEDLERFDGYDRYMIDSSTVLLVRDKISKGIMGDIKPLKPRMAMMTESFRVEELADWIDDKLVAVEPKYNGLRMLIEKTDNNVRVLTDSLRDVSDSLGKYFTDILKVDEDIIVDSSVTIYRGSRVLPRIELMKLMAREPEIREDELVCAIMFDILHYGEDLTDRDFRERRSILEKVYKCSLEGSRNFELSECRIVRGVEGVKKLWDNFSRMPQSEGIMLKYVDSRYDKSGVTSDWVKVKKELEIKVKVLEILTNRTGARNYVCGLLKGDARVSNEMYDDKYVVIGKTFSSKLEVKPGDILTVGVTEIIPGEEISWVAPRVIDKDESLREPYYVEQVIDLARRHNILQVAKGEGNVSYKVGDKGEGVLQLHIMGIEDISKLEEKKAEVYRLRQDIDKLRELLLEVIGEQSCHIDFRLVRDGDEYFEGGHIMVGNISGLEKLSEVSSGRKLRWGFKIPHAEEPYADVVRGSKKWMEIGFGEIDIIEPGCVGATSNKYSAIIGLDKFRWEMVLGDRHAKKIYIEVAGGLIPSGIYLISFVPVEEGRIWMINFLKKSLDIDSRIIVKSEEERIVCGIVYSPDEVDSQGDYATAEEIRKASYRFMEGVQKFRVNHSKPVVARILESYISPDNLVINGYFVKEGSWILVTRVLDDEVWSMIKSGDLVGYSMRGSAIHIGDN